MQSEIATYILAKKNDFFVASHPLARFPSLPSATAFAVLSFEVLSYFTLQDHSFRYFTLRDRSVMPRTNPFYLQNFMRHSEIKLG